MKTNTIQVFKEMVDDFYNSIPNETKKEMYNKHLEDVEQKNKFIKEITSSKNNDMIDNDLLNSSKLLARKRKINANKRDYSNYKIKPMDITDFIKNKIALMLMESNWNFLVSGGLNLDEVGQFYGICRERVRQIESRALKIFKNLNTLKQLNKDAKIEDILEMAYKNRSKRELVYENN